MAGTLTVETFGWGQVDDYKILEVLKKNRKGGKYKGMRLVTVARRAVGFSEDRPSWKVMDAVRRHLEKLPNVMEVRTAKTHEHLWRYVSDETLERMASIKDDRRKLSEALEAKVQAWLEPRLLDGRVQAQLRDTLDDEYCWDGVVIFGLEVRTTSTGNPRIYLRTGSVGSGKYYALLDMGLIDELLNAAVAFEKVAAKVRETEDWT